MLELSRKIRVFLLCLHVGSVFSSENGDRVFSIEKPRTFPRGFIFSTATSSYQVEGAWNVSGKGVNIWDEVVHKNPEFIKDRSNGDVAGDSYHFYKEDVKFIKEIGFKMYRFSISWARVLPDGTKSNINEHGLKYYQNLICELLRNDITPMVTIYHWELPQKLQEKGGWLNPKIVDWFEEYADLLFSRFGDKVKWWITINEPMFLASGYGSKDFAPALNLNGVGEYIAGHYALKAHARAYKLYQTKYLHQQGKISTSLNVNGWFPLDKDNEEDVRAVERRLQFELGRFAHPIFSTFGDYPAMVRNIVDRNSMREGRNTSRLPYFNEEEINELKGSADFFALNYYTSRLCTSGKMGPNPSLERDAEVVSSVNASWAKGQATWLYVVPEGLRQILNWIDVKYNKPEIFITENGYADCKSLCDQGRIDYLERHLSQIRNSIYEDGVKVIGYTVWSLLDTFEWTDGYTVNFGLVRVNFTDPFKKRTMKASGKFMKDYIQGCCLT